MRIRIPGLKFFEYLYLLGSKITIQKETTGLNEVCTENISANLRLTTEKETALHCKPDGWNQGDSRVIRKIQKKEKDRLPPCLTVYKN